MAQHPELYEIAYSLGLLLAEMKNYKDAEIFLAKAAAGMPGNGRVHYNHGQLLLILGRAQKAQVALETALALEPQNQDFFVALVNGYFRSGQPGRARALAENTLRRFPDHEAAKKILTVMDN